jgi:hypothetical protein
MPTLRLAAMLAISALLLATGATEALASHGGGGGGGAPPPPPPPAGTPTVSLSPSSATYGPQDVGTTSAPQTITITDTGTAPLFFSGMRQGGLNPIDFAEIDDQCVGITIAAGASCTITLVFKPTATGTRTATLSVGDSAANSPQVVTLTGTGTSLAGPTPISVDPGGDICTAGVCNLGTTPLINDFFFANFNAVGDTTPPFTWTLAGGTLPPGMTLFPNGSMYGTLTAIGTYTFTLRVTDLGGKTATQAFGVTVQPVPAPGDPGCQHAPSSSNAALTGPAIAGKTPSGQAIGDQSKLTACGDQRQRQERQPPQWNGPLGDHGPADRDDHDLGRRRHDAAVHPQQRPAQKEHRDLPRAAAGQCDSDGRAGGRVRLIRP